MEPRCDICKHSMIISDYKDYSLGDFDIYHTCHFAPPVPAVVGNKIIFMFPQVNPDDFCSKFKPTTGE